MRHPGGAGGRHGWCRFVEPAALVLGLLVTASIVGRAQGPGGADAAQGPATARVQAPIDPTGYWVANISEDWRWRMVTPAKGDYASIPLTPGAKRLADTWDPVKDEAAGEQCRSYGAPGLMRAPTRLRFSWLDDSTLRMESDYGMQTRLFRFGPRTPAAEAARASWQGETTAQWIMPAGGRGQGQGAGGGGGRAGGVATPRFGSLKTITTRLRPGYLRKNGVPYSANTVLTEYWDVHRREDGDQWMVVTLVVDDAANLQLPWVTSMHFKKEPDGSRWDPTPCSARW
jgi:hypothetical protein